MTRTLTLAAALALSLAACSTSDAAEQAVRIAPPKLDAPETRSEAVAVFAGGCFWGVEAVFEAVKGVKRVTSGYAGGTADTARYDLVSAEQTRHAEAVRIVYDPRQISYGRLMQIFFSVAHDPTQLNRQGPDTGPSYRSAIFPQNAAQRQAASAYIAQLEAARNWAKPIVTRIETGTFYPAETYHQDFMRRNPNHPYIVRWDRPKLASLRTAYPALVR